jgi:hypothetical protein
MLSRHPVSSMTGARIDRSTVLRKRSSCLPRSATLPPPLRTTTCDITSSGILLAPLGLVALKQVPLPLQLPNHHVAADAGTI